MSTPVNRLRSADGELESERARLVRLCARLSGDPWSAEDLAQETLVEAWRGAHKLNDPCGRSQWLSAIARNVCLRWTRQRGRDYRLYTPSTDFGDPAGPEHDDDVADTCDLEVELERHELAALLDRALALLPPQTREVLVARYVHESPHAEIAARLGISEKAVSMRLSRGKLLLRHALTTTFAEEASSYGLPIAREAEGWRETRIWCALCGSRRLHGILTGDRFSLRCPDCQPKSGGVFLHAEAETAAIHGGVHGFKAALNRRMAWAYDYATSGLAAGSMPCLRCRRPCTPRMGLPPSTSPELRDVRGVSYRCAVCRFQFWQSLDGLAWSHPAGRRFWRRHPRVRTLPARDIEAGGRPATLFSFESVVDSVRLDVVSARDTCEVLATYESAGC